MLSRSRRITSYTHWQKVHKQSTSVHSIEIVIKFLKNKLLFSRFGFIVGTKVSSKANKRNLVKRKLRAIVQKNLKDIKNGYDIILIARPNITKKTYQELEQRIIRLLKSAKLFQ